jgi:hypothetical protein
LVRGIKGDFSFLKKSLVTKDGIEEILNLQPKGSKAKPYQVKQVRRLMLKYELYQEDE